MIASRYNQIASEMPYVLHDVRIPANLQACHKRTYWSLLVLNTLPAIIDFAIGIPYGNIVYVKKEQPRGNLMKNILLANIVPGAILAILTGIVLMRSVHKIKNFYQENNLKEELNIKALTLHASAFGAYMISTL
jgi:hypothetical protein